MDHSSPRAGLPADPQRFFIPVETDRVRVLAFDSRATFLLYQKYGSGFFWHLCERDSGAPEPEKGEQRPIRLRSHESLAYFLWAGFLRDAEDAGEVLTVQDVEAMILPTTMAPLASALLVALSATQRAPRKAEPKNV